MLSENDYYHPDQALGKIYEQQAMLKTTMDTQVILQLMVSKGIVTTEEVNNMRRKVAELPTYKSTLENLDNEEKAVKYGKDHPDELLKALFNHKLKK